MPRKRQVAESVNVEASVPQMAFDEEPCPYKKLRKITLMAKVKQLLRNVEVLTKRSNHCNAMFTEGRKTSITSKIGLNPWSNRTSWLQISVFSWERILVGLLKVFLKAMNKTLRETIYMLAITIQKLLFSKGIWLWRKVFKFVTCFKHLHLGY